VDRALLEILRCPYCGTALELVSNDALVVEGAEIAQGVLGCECCAYPVVDGIPVLLADDDTRRALHTLEDGRPDDALLDLLGGGHDEKGRERLVEIFGGAPATYREALALLCDDAEGTYLLHRYADPTYVTMEALLRAIAQAEWPLEGRVLDLCGGAGHVTRLLRSLQAGLGHRSAGVVVADLYFWKLWLARRFVSPGAQAISCNADDPLPFARETFSTVLLADAFPYIWHKRLAAGEMMRLVGPDGLVVMPHLHSSAGENHSAGDTLAPASYRGLFDGRDARLFSDAALFDDAVARQVVDLSRDRTPDELGAEPSLTLLSTERSDLFECYEVRPAREVTGTLIVNPLYRVDVDGGVSTLTLHFPSPEYEDEFGGCRSYLPESLALQADLSGAITPELFSGNYGELRDSRVLIDAPEGY